MIRQLIGLLTTHERIKIIGLSVLLLIGSLLEIIGIGLILPFLRIVSKPELVMNHPWLGVTIRNIGIASRDKVILSASVILLAVFFIKSIYLAIQWKISFRFTYNKMVALMRRLLETYLNSPYTFHLQRNTAELIRNAQIEAHNVAGVFQIGITLLTEIIVTLGLVGVLLIVDPVTALAGFLVLGLVGWGSVSYFQGRLKRLGSSRFEHEGRMLQWISHSLGAVREIKILGKEAYFVESFQRSSRLYAEALEKSSLFAQYPRLLMETFAASAFVGVIVSRLFLKNDLADLIPILALSGVAIVRLLPSVNRIVSAINSLHFYTPSVAIVHKEFSDTKKIEHPSPRDGYARSITFQRAIELDHVSYRYANVSADSLCDISLAIKRGQAVAFIGRSGAGKTTVANLILGLLRPSSGRILVDGIDIQESMGSWQRQLGYIPQDIYLMDDSIRRNVALGLREEEIDETSVWKALDAAQIATLVRGLPEGLDTLVGERGVRLSGGERQRIGIARALYHDPKVLVLDEATSALDYETERDFWSAIDRVSASKTLIIIAHRLATVEHVDTIFLLEDGRVVGSGTYEKLTLTNPAFQRFLSAARLDLSNNEHVGCLPYPAE